MSSEACEATLGKPELAASCDNLCKYWLNSARVSHSPRPLESNAARPRRIKASPSMSLERSSTNCSSSKACSGNIEISNGIARSY